MYVRVHETFVKINFVIFLSLLVCCKYIVRILNNRFIFTSFQKFCILFPAYGPADLVEHGQFSVLAHWATQPSKCALQTYDIPTRVQ